MYFCCSYCKSSSRRSAVAESERFCRANERNRFVYGPVWEYAKRFGAKKSHYFTDRDQGAIEAELNTKSPISVIKCCFDC